jgi:hypothetical protein
MSKTGFNLEYQNIAVNFCLLQKKKKFSIQNLNITISQPKLTTLVKS